MAQDELKNKDCGENNIAQQQQPAVSGGAAVQKAPLSKEEKIKRIKGILDFPKALKSEASTLYIKVKGRPIK